MLSFEIAMKKNEPIVHHSNFKYSSFTNLAEILLCSHQDLDHKAEESGGCNV